VILESRSDILLMLGYFYPSQTSFPRNAFFAQPNILLQPRYLIPAKHSFPRMQKCTFLFLVFCFPCKLIWIQERLFLCPLAFFVNLLLLSICVLGFPTAVSNLSFYLSFYIFFYTFFVNLLLLSIRVLVVPPAILTFSFYLSFYIFFSTFFVILLLLSICVLVFPTTILNLSFYLSFYIFFFTSYSNDNFPIHWSHTGNCRIKPPIPLR